jgi:hypothetical protein
VAAALRPNGRPFDVAPSCPVESIGLQRHNWLPQQPIGHALTSRTPDRAPSLWARQTRHGYDHSVADVRPFRALRYDEAAGDLDRLVCPPYDVIDDAERQELLAASPNNAVRLELPELSYDLVGALIDGWLGAGILARSRRVDADVHA